MRALPTGSVTLLFTDIEGSTRLLRELGEGYADTLATQRRLLRTAFADHDGVEVDTQGDAFFVAFARASDAIAAARDAQRALAGTPVRVRMGIHTGTPTVGTEGYVGMDVHRGARICAAGHGGQVLLSRTTRDLLEPETLVRDLGEHRLKDLPAPEWLFQLLARGVETEFPPLRTLNNTNLPAHATSLIGRESELAELTALLADEEVRLLTLTGPGGIGKTRLATHLAGRLVEHFGNGVFLVSLAPVSDPDLVLPTVTQTLGVADVAGQTPLERLGGFLRGRSLLLVLDNFEHLLPAAPEIAQLLALESQLKVIVTSRERLSVTGEHERILAPLALGDAVTLFAERARAADSRFERAAAHDAVAGICDRVDRLPLAIELAAARVKHVPADELLVRLDRRLAALTTAPRDAPERHRTLEATIGWSYDLLTEAEQTLFMRLSVFSGGCTMESAAAICGATEDSMASLIDKSLLSRRDDRYQMLETVREYAAERLAASGDEGMFRNRHAEHFVGLAERAEPLLKRAEQVTWLARLEQEHDNFRTVLAASLEQDEGALALRVGGALWRFWLVRGRLAEGRRWLELALSSPNGGAARAKALFGCAVLSGTFGDRARALECFTEALSLYRATGDEIGAARSVWGIGVSGTGFDARLLHIEEALASQRRLGDRDGMARSLMSLGSAAWVRGDFSASASAYAEALALFRVLGDLLSVAQALCGLANPIRARSDPATARRYYEEALGIYRLLEDRASTADTLCLLAIIARDSGDRDSVRSLALEALAIARELGIPPLTADPLGHLAKLASDEGDYARARSLLAEVLTLVDDGFGRAFALSELGDVARLEGNNEEGARLQREGLKLYWSIGATLMTMRCMERLAFAIVPAGHAARGCRLLAAAEAQRRRITGVPRPPIQQPAVDACRERLRDLLGPEGFAAAWGEGEAMTLNEAVDYALAEPTPARL